MLRFDFFGWTVSNLETITYFSLWMQRLFPVRVYFTYRADEQLIMSSGYFDFDRLLQVLFQLSSKYVSEKINIEFNNKMNAIYVYLV